MRTIPGFLTLRYHAATVLLLVACIFPSSAISQVATLRFDHANGPTGKTIIRNSGDPVVLAWRTQGLPSGTMCEIRRREGNAAVASIPSGSLASGTRIFTTMHAWSSGIKTLYVYCSNGVQSPDIKLTIATGAATGTATLRFDHANGPTGKTIIRNSGDPVVLAWRTQGLPAGTACEIRRREGDAAVASIPSGSLASGTRIFTTMHAWSSGIKTLYVYCSNGVQSPDIKLTIATGAATGTATLRFDHANGSTGKTIIRNSGDPVVLAWRTQGLPSGTTCEIRRREGDAAVASIPSASLGAGTRTFPTMHAWSSGIKTLYLYCSNGIQSPDIKLTIGAQGGGYTLTVQTMGSGSGFVSSSPSGIDNCTATCQSNFAVNATVTLAAVPADGNSVFGGWTGACMGMSSTCTLSMNASKTVGASFQVAGGGGSEILSVATGGEHSCALDDSGAVWCWGDNQYGQLGDGTRLTRSTPSVVAGLPAGVEAIEAGAYSSCALTTGGAAWCWGRNQHGEIGDGSTTDRLVPVPVSGLSSGVRKIALGYQYGCALKSDGSVRCWGWNDYGQLGDGTAVSRRTPVIVSGLGNVVSEISAGNLHSCALLNSGAVRCWGFNYYGQLGNASQQDSQVPVQVSGLVSGVRALGAGTRHSCAVMNNGSIRCWGYNEDGQLGDGTIVSRSTPISVVGLSGVGVASVNLGESHTCALTSGGTVWCWGDNRYGQLGNGSSANARTPVRVSGLPGSIQTIGSRSYRHTCAVTADGRVRCWGMNQFGQLGDGSFVDRSTPVEVPGLPGGDSTSSYLLSVQKAGNGNGTVTSSPGGINGCSSTCQANFPANTQVTLTAVAAGSDSVFAGWTGACSGAAATCTLTMNAAKTVGANFSTSPGPGQSSCTGLSGTVSDPNESSLPDDRLDLRSFSWRISGDQLEAEFRTWLYPLRLPVNRSGIASSQLEYAWGVYIDVDGNTATGNQQPYSSATGAEYELSITYWHGSHYASEVELWRMQRDLWALNASGGWTAEPGEPELIELADSFVLKARIPGLSSRSRLIPHTDWASPAHGYGYFLRDTVSGCVQ